MAWVPIAMAIASTVIAVAGQRKQAKEAKAAGINAQLSENYRAAQMDQAAGQEFAASQRAAEEDKRRAHLMASRAMALAGAGGGGLSDPTMVNLIGDLEGEGSYRAALDIYGGQDRARSLRQGADTARYQGEIALHQGGRLASAYNTQAVGTAFAGASSLYSKYNSRGAPAQQPGAPVEDRRPYGSSYGYGESVDARFR